ncbi:MAG: hypothetical protein KBT20_01455 [Bacteroidales bacterium]|nr:hypothetical protein [Candidatus Liminaster caballi]
MSRNIHYNIIALLLLGAVTPAFGQTIKGNVYGGGNLSQVVGGATINIKSGAISEKTADDEYGNIYGGGYGASAVLTGNTTINVTGGTIAKDAYGGGALANVTGSTEVNIKGGTVTQDVYGGGALANVSANTSVNLTGGTIRHSYGGGLGSADVAALIGGDATTTLNGTIVLGNVFGCNNVNGTPKGRPFVDVKKTTAKGTETAEHPYHVLGVYGGGNLAAYVPSAATIEAHKDSTVVLIENCDNSIKDVFGGGNAAAVPGTDVTVWGGVLGRVFAGGNGESAPANVTGDTHVMIHGGTIHEVYGGSNNSGDIGGTIYVNVAEQKYGDNDLCPVNVADLYGGGNLAASNAGQISIGKCTDINRVFGGAHNADVNGDITLNINDGHLDNVFGGNNEGGQVNGNITVNIDWADDAVASLGNVYGGGNIANINNAEPRTITVNFIDATATGSVFGGGKGREAYIKGTTNVNIGDWVEGHHAEVNGNVFGGGDLAGVEGACNVIVRDCGTIIHGDLYGGGNAAPAFETNTTMWGGLVMGNLFGGGNGVNLDPVTGNPNGARVGYNHDDTENAECSGNANTNLFGGTIGTWTTTDGICADNTGGVFGGSNSNGNIRGNINLLLDERVCTETDPGIQCEMKLKEVYGAGNEAAYDGLGIDLTLGCVSYLGEIYGGAKAADLNTDAVLNITSGHFGRVFGGNNMSGKLNGSITVNIDETGCYPVIIDELYGGGNEAAYSVYGYENELDANGKVIVKTSGDAKADPQVNIISCTRIGRIFGGGLGESAVMVGNPTVNINQIPGRYANLIDYDGDGNQDGDDSILGEIGVVFGGGNAAKVVGNTVVRIGTEAQSKHLGADDSTLTDSGANISGNVYGGGNQADVTGKTNVTIGR